MIAKEFIRGLDNISKTKDGYQVSCPAHDDSTASLTVSDGDKGLLLYCHAGCTIKDIMVAIGKKESDLFEVEKKPAKRIDWTKTKATKDYPYYNLDGSVNSVKVRLEPCIYTDGSEKKKHFLIKTPSGNDKKPWKWSKPDNEILYNLPAINVEGLSTIYIAEGEKDVDTLADFGLAGTCNIYGGSKGESKWPDTFEYNKSFENKDIVLFQDLDETGNKQVQSVMKIIAKHFPQNRFKIIDLPGLRGKEYGEKDISDWASLGHNRAELIEIIDKTPWINTTLLNKQYPLTDAGNAERFADHFKDKILYCHAWESWLIWTGKVWEVDRQSSIISKAVEVARLIQVDGEKIKNNDVIGHGLKLEGKGKIESMLYIARGMMAISPDELDTNLYLFNVHNGTINLHTGQLQKHNRSDYITRLSQYKYNKDALCPNWDNFLCRVLADDIELYKAIQRSVGYSLSGLTSEQCLFFLYGKGNNGKSTFLEIIISLMKGFSGKLQAESLMKKAIQGDGQTNDLAGLNGKRLVVSTEIEEGDRLNEARVKDITGGDTLSVRFLHKEFFDMIPQFKLWVYGNHKPHINSNDAGIWRRIKLIPFEVFIPTEERDGKLKEKLQLEIEGILAWAVQGFMMWEQDGLKMPERVQKAIEEYRSDMDVIGAFIEDRCTLGKENTILAGALYERYKIWCLDNGHRPFNMVNFGNKIGDKLKDIDGSKNKTRNGIQYIGIC